MSENPSSKVIDLMLTTKSALKLSNSMNFVSVVFKLKKFYFLTILFVFSSYSGHVQVVGSRCEAGVAVAAERVGRGSVENKDGIR